MTQYSVETKDGIFVKDYEFLSFARNMGKKIGKILIINSQSDTDPLKSFSKRAIKKQQKQLVIWLAIKFLTEL